MTIHLAADLSLPLDVGTQTLLVLGKRGSGKTNTCVVFAEELYKAKTPFVVIDPVDVWWGLKAAKDGKGAGIGVYVFGGRHADLPLEPTAGELLADVLVDHRISAVLSIRTFNAAERSRFVTDFAKRLFQRNIEPLHVFLEEAHELAPQDPRAAEARPEMIGAISRLWKLGRSSGLGGSAISQRPASLSKNVTTQAEILIVHRTIGPQDVAAVKEWIRYHGESEDILSQLGSLKTGECFVWGPDFPERSPIGLRRVRIRERETFDSSATPKAGQKRAEPRLLAPVDLAALRSRMAGTIERAKAEDPRELRKRIAELEKELRAARAVVPTNVSEEDLEQAREEAWNEGWSEGIDAGLDRLEKTGEQIAALIESALKDGPPDPRPRAVVSRPSRAVRPAPVDRPNRSSGSVDAAPRQFPGPQQAILDAIAWLNWAGVERPTKVQVAARAGYAVGGGGFRNPLGALRTSGWITYEPGDVVRLTEPGRAAAREPETPPTTEALHESVLGTLPGNTHRRILRVVLDAYPRTLDVAEVAAALEPPMEPGGGGFRNPLGRLHTLGLLEYPERGKVRASDVLFLEG